MRILIVKLSSLGDVVQAMPVVSDLRAALPPATIDWVVEESFAPLVECVVGVERVLRFAGRRWRKSWLDAATRAERTAFYTALRAVEYDAVLDIQGLIKSGMVARKARLSATGFRATYGNRSEECGYEWPTRFFANRLVPMPRRVHAVQRYRVLAAGALGYELKTPPVYQLRVERPAPVRAVVLAHGTTRPDNEWPQADWAAIGQRLAADGFEVWLPHASDAELRLATALATAIGPKARVWPRLSLAGVLREMAAATGVIGVDSGLSHMAVALDLLHVQIFSYPRAWRAGPVGHAHQVPVGGERAPSVDEVWAAWQGVLAAAPRPVPR
nr:lipopolysaccharide heptosyltransferase I [Variovorax boronicumulans]